MIWIVFVFGVVAILLVAFHFSYSSGERLIRQIKKRIKMIKSKLRIAEKRYRKREISRSLFEALQDELQSEMAQQELLIVRMRINKSLPAEGDIDRFLGHVEVPTKRLRAETKPLVKEIAALEKELEFLEKRLLGRKIKKSVFERLAKDKQLNMIQKEAELFEILNKEN